MLQEEMKVYPFGDVWDYFCEMNEVPAKEDWYKEVKTYEEEVLALRQQIVLAYGQGIKERMKMNILETKVIEGFCRMCQEGYDLGWHERNGGNLTYRMKNEEVEEVKASFEPKEQKPIGTSVPGLAGEYFIVTGSGKYFRLFLK